MKRPVKLLLQTLVLAGCLIYVLSGIDYGILVQSLSKMAPFGLVMVFILIVFDFLVMGFRLKLIAVQKISYITAFNSAVIGLGINNILPAKAGEIAKALYLKKKGNVHIGRSVGFVFLERFSDLNMLLLGILTAAAMYKSKVALISLTSMVVLFWGCLIILKIFPEFMLQVLEIPGLNYFKSFVTELIAQLRENLSIVFVVRLILVSIVVWLIYCFQHIVLLTLAIDLGLSLTEIFIVFIMAVSGMALPATPGAVGVYEAFMVTALGLFGIDKEIALAVGLVYHMLLFLPSTLYALFVLFISGLDLKTIRTSSDEIPEKI